MKILEKINFRQPKYMLPAILYFPLARHVLFHLRPVSDRNDRNTRQGVADDGVPKPRIAGGTDQGRWHRQQIREYGEIMG